MKIKIKRIDKTLLLPDYQTAGSAGFDIYARESVSLAPAEIKTVPSNLIVEVPAGYSLIISARSSLQKKKLMLANSIGVIDQDYHGEKDEIGILIYNFGDGAAEINRGERIAQGLIVPIERAEWEEQEEMAENSRGGIGSTGK